jgi:hypothetical protein
LTTEKNVVLVQKMSLFEYTNNLILSRTQIGKISNPRGSVVKLSGTGFDVTFNITANILATRRKYKEFNVSGMKHIVSLRIISNVLFGYSYSLSIYNPILWVQKHLIRPQYERSKMYRRSRKKKFDYVLYRIRAGEYVKYKYIRNS